MRSRRASTTGRTEQQEYVRASDTHVQLETYDAELPPGEQNRRAQVPIRQA